jgi:hypothetical protein
MEADRGGCSEAASTEARGRLEEAAKEVAQESDEVKNTIQAARRAHVRAASALEGFMSELRTPDSLSTQAENDLICEKLLGWTKEKCFSQYDGRSMGFVWKRGERDYPGWPSFTTWADAGLILDALTNKYEEAIVTSTLPGCWLATAGNHGCSGDTGPLAIRAATLEYIRSLP